MKRIITFIILLAPLSASAQWSGKPTLPQDCIKYLSYYQQDYKEKKYDSALTNWRKAFLACPANTSQNMYVHGTTMMARLYNGAKDADYRKAIVDTILMLQDKRIENYPKKKAEILNNKGLYMVKYRGSDEKYLYDELPGIISELGGDASNSLMVSLFKAAVSLYGKKVLQGEDVLNTYDLVSDAMDRQRPETDEKKSDLSSARTAIGTLYAGCGLADCNSLIGTFTPRFEKEPDNAALAATIVRLMNTAEDCAGSDLYFKAVTTLHNQAPSHRSAYALFRMNAARGNTADAGAYLEQAIGAEDSDAETDARYWYELGLFAYKNKMRSKAAEAAQKAIGLDCGYAGKAYLLIGNLWSGAPCESELNQYARYWAAADNYQKAKELDPSIEEDAKAGLASASRHYPEPSEIFMFDLTAGQGYTVSCGGLTARTTVRVKQGR